MTLNCIIYIFYNFDKEGLGGADVYIFYMRCENAIMRVVSKHASLLYLEGSRRFIFTLWAT
jgi:hypothetical protein